MPPPRSRPPPDLELSEGSSIKEKAGMNIATAPNGKSRRLPGNTAGGSSLRDIVTAGSGSLVVGTSNTASADATPGVSLFSQPATPLLL